jgi:hypothetical protein
MHQKAISTWLKERRTKDVSREAIAFNCVVEILQIDDVCPGRELKF